MWLGEGVDCDYDEVKKGATVKVSALQDSEGDWIVTEIKAVKKAGSKKGGKSSGKSGGKKSTKKK
jgi:hypothetical protein